MNRIACLFPGIGYTCDKPLLYYSGEMLRGMGYEIVLVPYQGFPEGVKGDRLKMQQSAHIALDQAEEMLKHIEWEYYDDILFIGKSIGTVVCTAYAKRHDLKTRQILFTPVEGTFQFAGTSAIAFHGTADPWVETRIVREACDRMNIPLYEVPHANHSLETGRVAEDIAELEKIMQLVRNYINPFEFRMIHPEEADQAIEIEAVCFPPNEACKAEHMIPRIHAAADFFLVAEDTRSGKLAGFINGIATDEECFRDEFFMDASIHDSEGKNIMILGLDVMPIYRRQGLARKLVREYAERFSTRRLVLTCHDSLVPMYEKFGFRDLGASASIWGGENWREMERKSKE